MWQHLKGHIALHHLGLVQATAPPLCIQASRVDWIDVRQCRFTPSVTTSSAEFYGTARSALDSLATYVSVVQPQVPAAVASQQQVQSMNSNIQQFLAGARDVPVTVCPVNCLNMGSFYGKLTCNASRCCCLQLKWCMLKQRCWSRQLHSGDGNSFILSCHHEPVVHAALAVDQLQMS